jgi:hypothetical protein
MELTFRVNKPAVSRLLGGPDGPVARVILPIRCRRVVSRARQLAPRWTGGLADSIYFKIIRDSGGLAGIVGAKSKHAIFQERGTGIYGPLHRVIVAKPGKVFVFPDRATGKLVFTRRIKGTPATHFLRRSLEAVR